MDDAKSKLIPGLLLKSIPRDLIMGIEEGLIIGALRAYDASADMDPGHRANALGQNRHFKMNEGFYEALLTGGASPGPLRGNNIVTGHSGNFVLGRFNISAGVWNNGRRSNLRRQLSLANLAMEPLVQPGLFSQILPLNDLVVFFVSCFSGSLYYQPEKPVSIEIAVPDSKMEGWLFRESLPMFLKRYNVDSKQIDTAIPVLKSGIIKKLDSDE